MTPQQKELWSRVYAAVINSLYYKVAADEARLYAKREADLAVKYMEVPDAKEYKE